MKVKVDQDYKTFEDDLLNANKIVVFGAAEAAKEYVKELQERFYIDCVIDNRSAILKEYMGVRVVGPDAICKLGENDVVLVASRSFENILNQLADSDFCGIVYALTMQRLHERFYQLSLKDNGVNVFDDRRSHVSNLLIAVCGYQPYYWDGVLGRVRENQRIFSEKMDVCICVPKGKTDALDALRDICKEYGWSYLQTDTNQLAKAQNIALLLHPNAEWIYKLDEDIVIGFDYFTTLKGAYLNAGHAIRKNVGFIAPLLNINFCGTEAFINERDLLQEYEETFGQICYGWSSAPFIRGDIAQWIWEKSTPFDVIAKHFASHCANQYHECSNRFSVGALLFPRSFWAGLGGFKVAPEGVLGVEESQMNEYCINNARVMVIAKEVFAGHLGFGSQKEAVRRFYEDHPSLFSIMW